MTLVNSMLPRSAECFSRVTNITADLLYINMGFPSVITLVLSRVL